MNLSNQLAVQSYCFRHLKIQEELRDAVLETGFDKIELCGVHVNFNEVQTFDKVIDFYKKSSIQIVSIGVNTIRNEPADENYFIFAKKCGLEAMSVSFLPALDTLAFRAAEKLAEKYDVRLGIHNHGGYHWLGSLKMLQNVFQNTNERIGLWLDTAWALQAGEKPLKMVEEFKGRLYGVHLKDFIFDRAAKWTDVVIGKGNLDLPAVVRLLDENNFQGPCIVEYEGPPETVISSLKDCVKAFEQATSTLNLASK
jgi:inosose dehydratase